MFSNLLFILIILINMTSQTVVIDSSIISGNLSQKFIDRLNDKSYILDQFKVKTIDSTYQLLQHEPIIVEARKVRRIRYKKYINQELAYTSSETNYYGFSYIVRDSSKRNLKLRNNTFQLNPYDKGNYNSRGQLVGTNRSISAPVYEKYLGKVPTQRDMEQLSYNVALKIYKKKFWDTYMNGDSMKVHNPILLDMIFNAICSSAGSHHFKDVLYEMTNFKIKKWKLKWITLDEIAVFNDLCSDINKENEFYQRYWNIRNNYYNKRAKRKGLKGLSKWIKSYPYDVYSQT